LIDSMDFPSRLTFPLTGLPHQWGAVLSFSLPRPPQVPLYCRLGRRMVSSFAENRDKDPQRTHSDRFDHLPGSTSSDKLLVLLRPSLDWLR